MTNCGKSPDSYIEREPPGHPLQATTLGHEAYIRLIHAGQVQCQSELIVFAVSANLMRRILVDYARSQNYVKRGVRPGTSHRMRTRWYLRSALRTCLRLTKQQEPGRGVALLRGLNVEETNRGDEIVAANGSVRGRNCHTEPSDLLSSGSRVSTVVPSRGANSMQFDKDTTRRDFLQAVGASPSLALPREEASQINALSSAKFTPVDLSSHFNMSQPELGAAFDDGSREGFGGIPTGSQKLQGIPFMLGPGGSAKSWLLLRDQAVEVPLAHQKAGFVCFAHFCDRFESDFFKNGEGLDGGAGGPGGGVEFGQPSCGAVGRFVHSRRGSCARAPYFARRRNNGLGGN